MLSDQHTIVVNRDWPVNERGKLLESARIHCLSVRGLITVVTRPVRQSSVVTPAKTELTGCFSGRSGRARTCEHVLAGYTVSISVCRRLHDSEGGNRYGLEDQEVVDD